MAKKQEENVVPGIEEFESALSKTEQFFEDNQKIITYIVGGIIVVVGLFVGFKKLYLAPKEKEAQSQMFVAERYFSTDSFAIALEGDGNYLGFTDIADEYGITKSGKLAKYYAGICHYKLGNYEEAIDYLKEFKSSDFMVGTIALGAIGDAYMELGDDENALSFYLKAAERKTNNFTSPIYLMKAALVYEKMTEYTKALELFEKIKSDYPGSYEAKVAEKYIANVEILVNKE